MATERGVCVVSHLFQICLFLSRGKLCESGIDKIAYERRPSYKGVSTWNNSDWCQLRVHHTSSARSRILVTHLTERRQQTSKVYQPSGGRNDRKSWLQPSEDISSLPRLGRRRVPGGRDIGWLVQVAASDVPHEGRHKLKLELVSTDHPILFTIEQRKNGRTTANTKRQGPF